MHLVRRIISSTFDPKSILCRFNRHRTSIRTTLSIEIQSVDRNWDKRRTYHVHKGSNFVRRMLRSTFNPGLSIVVVQIKVSEQRQTIFRNEAILLYFIVFASTSVPPMLRILDLLLFILSLSLKNVLVTRDY